MKGFGEMNINDEVISIVYGSKGVFLGLCDMYICVCFMYWVRYLCFKQFICTILSLDGSLGVFDSIINCKAVFLIDYNMGGCFCSICFFADLLFVYVLLDELCLTLFLAASVVKRYIRRGVFMHFIGTESQS